jgi:aspartate 4-decarboxylase
MAEIIYAPCNEKYKITVDVKDEAYKYTKLSPFEFKNILIKLAENNGEILNAGRGNPNFFSTLPRYAFGLLTIFSSKLGNQESDIENIGFFPEKKGIATKFRKFLSLNNNTPTGKFLSHAFEEMIKITKFQEDELVHQLVMSTIGCFYPSPPRVQPFVEPILVEFLAKRVYRSNIGKNVKVFPTEGAAAGIIYTFNSLKYNKLVVEGDTIGMLTPIFSPYLEIPNLQNYNLVQVCIKASENKDWEIPDSELKKIANPKMKAIFICNPTNPTALSLSSKTTSKIKSIVKTKNPNLIVIADNVYAPFVNEFNSLMNSLPYNTIGIYSLSKYFGVTGWRLGIVALNNDNIIDNKLLKNVPPIVNKRYSMVTTKPENIKFIDRMLMDSRQVAEAHTAGLSTPQQVIMTLFAMYDYLDGNRIYNTSLQKILKNRIKLLLQPIQYKLKESNLNTNYYIIIDLIKVSLNLTKDKSFGQYLTKHKNPLEFLLLLAKDYGTVLLPAIGFAGPFWGVRVSIANLPTDKYKPIGENIRHLMLKYYKNYKKV